MSTYFFCLLSFSDDVGIADDFRLAHTFDVACYV